MATILDDILDTKRREVARRSAERSVDELKAIIKDRPRPRNFFAAVTRQTNKPVNVIAEIKKASPSAGVMRPNFDPVAIARQYATIGVDAISVLTDEQYFQGHLDDLVAVRAAVDLPVLRKDFVVDAWQVYESRAVGADAILLIAEALATNEMIDLQILATELNMTCLIEVHDIDNLMRVRDHVIGFPHKSYSLLGINNRDLRTFKTDLGTTLRLAELVEDKSVLVSESGVRAREDVLKLADAGIRAVLVGESLMRASDLASSFAAMFSPLD